MATEKVVPISERPPITPELIESYRHTISRDPSKRKVRYHFWLRGAHFIGKTEQQCIDQALAFYCTPQREAVTVTGYTPETPEQAEALADITQAAIRWLDRHPAT